MRPLPAMAPHLLAIEEHLTAGGWDVHIGDVLTPDPPLPYVMIHAHAGTPVDVNLARERVEIDEDIRLTVVSDTPLNCIQDTARVRALLAGHVLQVPGRACHPLRLTDSQPAIVDRQVTRPSTGTHPAYIVDSWRLTSTPLEET